MKPSQWIKARAQWYLTHREKMPDSNVSPSEQALYDFLDNNVGFKPPHVCQLFPCPHK